MRTRYLLNNDTNNVLIQLETLGEEKKNDSSVSDVFRYIEFLCFCVLLELAIQVFLQLTHIHWGDLFLLCDL